MITISKKRICAAVTAVALCAVSFSGCSAIKQSKIKKDPAAYLISLENGVKDSMLDSLKLSDDSDKDSKNNVSVDVMLSKQFMEDENYAEYYGIDAQDISGSVIIDSASSDDLLQNSIKLILNDEDIITVDSYIDCGKKDLYLSVPSEESKWYKVPADEAYEYSSEIGIANAQDIADTLSGVYTSLVDSYTKYITNSNVTFEPKYELTIDGVTQTCMEFTASFDDDDTLDMYDDFMSGFRKSNSSLYRSILSVIEEELDDDFEVEPEFTVKTYVDDSDKILGRIIEADIYINFPEYNDTYSISFEISDLSARKGKDHAFSKSAELSINADGERLDGNVSVLGKGSVGKGNLLSGDMIISSDLSSDDDYTERELGFINALDNMTLSFENVDLKALEDGNLTGTLIFDLEQMSSVLKWQIEELKDNIGISEENIHSKYDNLLGYKAVLTCESSKDGAHLINFKITDDSSDYLSVAVNYKSEELKEALTLPSDYVDLEDPYDIINEIDFESVAKTICRILGIDFE